MSRQWRLRATGAVLAALFVVGPLVANGTAQAELATSARDLVFGGGGRTMLGLSCAAEPRSGSMVVESGSTVRVVNATGHKADLLIDGVSKGELADDAATGVLFRRGPVELALKPDCMLRGPSDPATVTVSPSAPGPTDPVPLPSVDGSSAPPVDPSSPPATGTTKPSIKPTKSRRPNAGTPPRRPATGGTTIAATRTQAGMQRATVRTRTGTRTTTAGGTTPTGLPVTSVPATTVPVGGGTPGSSGPVLAAPEIAATPPETGAAAEPVAALEPVSHDRPTGLLALAATVCLAGVTAGAIRAIAAQRAYRASIA